MLYNIEINILVYITTSWEVDLVGEHLLSPVNSASPHTLTYTSNNCCLHVWNVKFTTVVTVLAVSSILGSPRHLNRITCVFKLTSYLFHFLLHTSVHSSVAGHCWLRHDLFCC